MKTPTKLIPRLSKLAAAMALICHGQLAAAAANPIIQIATIPTTTSGNPTLSRQSVGMDKNGNWVAIWVSAEEGILGRCYNRNARPAADLLTIDSTVIDQAPVVARSTEGHFMVVWQTPTGLVARRYNSSCSPLGTDITVSSSGANPSVALDKDSNFIVAWEDGTGGISVERFGADDQPQNLAISIQGSTPSVAMEPDGGGTFIVGFDTGDGTAVRRFDATGAQSGDDIQLAPNASSTTEKGADGGPYPWITTDTETVHAGTSVAMDANGEFVVGWQQDTSATTNTVKKVKNKKKCMKDEFGDTYCGYYDSAGEPADGPFSYAESYSESARSDVLVRRFDASGKPKDTTKTGDPSALAVSGKGKNGVGNKLSSIAMDSAGNVVVGWDKETSKTIKGKCTSDAYGQPDCAEDQIIIYSDATVQKYKNNGKANGRAINVSGRKEIADLGAAVAMDDAGDLVVGWSNDLVTRDRKVKNKKMCQKDEYGHLLKDEYGHPYCDWYTSDGEPADGPFSYVTETVADPSVNAKLYAKK